MALVSTNTRLSDIIFNSPEVVPVLNRFGIYMGVGDLSVGHACDGLGVDKNFFLTIINTFLDEAYFPENTLRSFCGEKIVHYLNEANRYYREFNLPNIERHFLSLIKSSGAQVNNLELILAFFLDIKKELLDAHDNDMRTWFQVLLAAERGDALPDELPEVADSTAINDRIADLKLMFVRHLKGYTEPNLTYAVLTAIVTFQRDVCQNNRIRDRILLPAYRSLRHAGSTNVSASAV